MFDAGQPVELRALGVTTDKYTQNKVYGGYFDDFDELAKSAAKLSPVSKGVYVTLNPPHSRLLARCYNRIVKSPKHTTSDSEIMHRTRLLIDVDAQRFSGIPSTPVEHQVALDRADEIARFLAGYDWPKPLYGDSGNGGHLIYAIDLPVNDNGLVKRVLESLAFLHDDDRVKVDTGVFNPARITRLYGTINRKGDNVPHLDMPHREALIISSPDHLLPVTKKLLEKVAAMQPEVPKG